jgi:hypothetical protein
MAVSFEVRLRAGQPEGDLLRYAPDEEIAGTATITTDSDLACNHLYLRLQWRTEGRGDRDEQNLAELDIYQGTLSPSTPITHDFRFRLPSSPWSYAGHYVSIVWAIQLNLDVPLTRDPVHYQPFILAPDR